MENRGYNVRAWFQFACKNISAHVASKVEQHSTSNVASPLEAYEPKRRKWSFLELQAEGSILAPSVINKNTRITKLDSCA